MGVWRGIKAIATLGGSMRLENAQRRYAEAAHRYEEVVEKIKIRRRDVSGIISDLKIRVTSTKRRFRVANRMMAPRCLAGLAQVSKSEMPYPRAAGGSSVSRFSSSSMSQVGSTTMVVGSALAGTTAAIAAWQGAQIVGIASTGTALFGLHGAAATNAGWALFGGGSLATGGGGMALGHLVLPGAGVVIAVGVGAVMTHREANKVNRLADEVDQANIQNKAVLCEIDQNFVRVHAAASKFDREDDLWTVSYREAKEKLRRFGWFSILYRFVRFKVSGVYYTAAEWAIVADLERATQHFFNAMGMVRNQ